MSAELETLTRKRREWCELKAPADGCSNVAPIRLDQVPRLLIALVRGKRETCAKAVDAYAESKDPRDGELALQAAAARDIADAIRERGR
jgi:hypothetical protein